MWLNSPAQALCYDDVNSVGIFLACVQAFDGYSHAFAIFRAQGFRRRQEAGFFVPVIALILEWGGVISVILLVLLVF